METVNEPGADQSASGSVRLRRRKGQSQQYMREYMRVYRQSPEYRERERQRAREYIQQPHVRKRVQKANFRNKVYAILMVAGEVACRKCRTDDIRVLTINHIGGGGTEDRKAHRFNTYFAIRTGQRTTEGLEVLCLNCNILHEYDRGTRARPNDWEQIVADAKAEAGL